MSQRRRARPGRAAGGRTSAGAGVRELVLRAAEFYRQGRFDRARDAFAQLVALVPGNADAHYNLGLATHRSRGAEPAIPHYREAVRLRPGFGDAWLNLGNALEEGGHDEEAEQSFLKALEVTPSGVGVLRSIANLHNRRGAFGKAAHYYQLARNSGDDNTETLLGLGYSLLFSGRAAEAVEILTIVVDRQPRHGMAHRFLGQALEAAFRIGEAEAALRKAIDLGVADSALFNALGNCLLKQERPKEAEAAYRRALELDVNLPGVLNNLGVVLASQGRRTEAGEAFRRAVGIRRDYGEPYRNLSLLTTYRDSDRGDVIKTMEALIDSGAAAEDAMHLHFALGKGYDDLGEYDAAFEHYAQANRARHRGSRADLAAFAALLDRIRSTFRPGLFSRHDDGGFVSAVPVFVVGLPRSGTTLVEQILAAHPRVEGTGERIIVNELLRELERRQPYPESVTDLTTAERKDLGTRYVEQLVKVLPGLDPVRVIDKMPYNFLHLGFIRLILPAATVIHCRRDPLDVCLSNFFQYFPNSSIDFSSDLEELGRFHQLYSRLMDHWRQVLPDDFLVEVEYEALIDHSEAVVRSLLAKLNLPWHDACLDFHRSERTVGSVSAWQVRQPMYRRSIGRWRNYEAHLSPLIRALGRNDGQSSR